MIDAGRPGATPAVGRPGSGWITIVIPDALQPLLRHAHRGPRVEVAHDRTSSVEHVLGSIGLPMSEIGTITRSASSVEVTRRERPQPTPTQPPRFVLDVHLGTLARRLRLLGLDTAWRNDADDVELVEQSLRERRVLLTQDRGILLRRAVRDAAYVRGSRPDDQLADVLDRFAPPLAPWTRCTACNGVLSPVAKAEVAHLLQPGTRRTYETFARCPDCGRVYWPGAHHERLRAIVDRASC